MVGKGFLMSSQSSTPNWTHGAWLSFLKTTVQEDFFPGSKDPPTEILSVLHSFIQWLLGHEPDSSSEESDHNNNTTEVKRTKGKNIYTNSVIFQLCHWPLGEGRKQSKKHCHAELLQSHQPLSRHSFLACSWRTLPRLQGGNLQSIAANLQEGPSCLFLFLFFLTFPKLLHPRTRLTFWLSAKEFVPWSGRQRIAHENGQLELTANNSDNNLATDFSRQGSRNGTVAFGTVQTQLLLFGGVPEMWGTYIWVGTTALWFTTSNLSTVGGFYSHSPSYSCSLKHLSASVQNTQQSCGQQQPPGISPFSYLCDRQAATLRQHHCFFYS